MEYFDIELATLFLMLNSFEVLNGRELKYCMWRFAGKENPEIAKLDGKSITPQGVQYIVMGAIKKLRARWRESKLLREEIRLNYI